jgi:hypothetical protein
MPRPYALWTDTDDAIVLAFPPAEAAEILGRTIQSVYHRRSLKDFGGANRDRKPRSRLRREYFSTGHGERDEAVPKRLRAKCRKCRRKVHADGLCKSCYSKKRYNERHREAADPR